MRMKNGTSQGEDGVAIEMIKEVSERMKEMVLRLFSKCCMEREVPER